MYHQQTLIIDITRSACYIGKVKPDENMYL